MQTFGKIILFRFFFITIFPEKAQNKNKVGIKTKFLLMMEMHEAKSPKQVHFHLRRDKRIFFRKHKTTNKHII